MQPYLFFILLSFAQDGASCAGRLNEVFRQHCRRETTRPVGIQTQRDFESLQNRKGDKTMFSIIVPIYNTEKYLKRCLDSILNQTCPEFELILVDDGSTDDSPAICNSYAQRDSRITVIHKENKGLVSARNTGLRMAKGDYICYVDSDDYIDLTLLEVMQKYIISANAPDILIFNAIRQYPDRQLPIPCRIETGFYDKERLEREIYPYMIIDKTLPYLGERLYPVAWNKVYKSALLKAHYCRDERITLAEDNAFVYECVYCAESAYFCRESLYYYNRCEEDSMSLRYNEDFLEQLSLVCQYMKQHLGCRSAILAEQLNGFTANTLMNAVLSEMEHYPQKKEAVQHIRRKISGSILLKECRLKSLPLKPKIFLFMLKMRCYRLVWHLAKLNAA